MTSTHGLGSRYSRVFPRRTSATVLSDSWARIKDKLLMLHPGPGYHALGFKHFIVITDELGAMSALPQARFQGN